MRYVKTNKETDRQIDKVDYYGPIRVNKGSKVLKAIQGPTQFPKHNILKIQSNRIRDSEIFRKTDMSFQVLECPNHVQKSTDTLDRFLSNLTE